MKLKVFFAFMLSLLIAACVSTTRDPTVGKADFAKLEQWFEQVQVLEGQLVQTEPKSEQEAVQLLDNVFDKAISTAENLSLSHVAVRDLRDKVVESLGYQRFVTRSMISPKYVAENSQAFYEKAEKLAVEVETLYEKLEREFAN